MRPALVEVSSTEVTTTLLPSGKDNIGSTYNSGEDIAIHPPVSDVHERSDFWNAGLTTVNTGETQVQNPFRINHSNRESSETSHFRTVCSNKRKSSRESNVCAGNCFSKRKDSF